MGKRNRAGLEFCDCRRYNCRSIPLYIYFKPATLDRQLVQSLLAMTHPIHVYPNQVLSLDETIWANADEETSKWSTYATGATTNTYVAVNSAGTSDWVWLRSGQEIYAESEGSRLLRYDMQSPS